MLMFLFFIVAIVVSFISVNFCINVIACGLADGGLGNVVKRQMLIKLKVNSNDNKTDVPKCLYKTALNGAANMAPEDMAKFVFPHSFNTTVALYA